MIGTIPEGVSCARPADSMTDEDALLSPREAATRFGMRAVTRATWAHAGKLAAEWTPGGQRRYRLSGYWPRPPAMGYRRGRLYDHDA